MLRYIIAFILIPFTISAQDPDTLLTSILNVTNDTARANQLYTVGFGLIDKDPPLAYKYAKNCQNAALNSKSLPHISKSNNLLGIVYFKFGEYSKSLLCFENYLSGSIKSNNKLGVAFAYTNLANIYLKIKQYAKAENYFLKALNDYNELNNKTEIANSLINLGVLKNERKQLDAAFEFYQKALQTGTELNNYEIKAICLNNMAQVFFDKGDYEKALAYNFDALELREIMAFDVDRSDSYLSIAETEIKLNDIPSAQQHLDTAIALCNKTENFEGQIKYYRLTSELEAQKNNYKLAYENLVIYNRLNDSLTLTQNIQTDYNFDLVEEVKAQTETQNINNLWLIVILAISLTTIIYTIFKNKR